MKQETLLNKLQLAQVSYKRLDFSGPIFYYLKSKYPYCFKQ